MITSDPITAISELPSSVGSSEQLIEKTENQLGISIPEIVREYLLVCGDKCDFFSWHIPLADAIDNDAEARDVWRDCNSDIELGKILVLGWNEIHDFLFIDTMEDGCPIRSCDYYGDTGIMRMSNDFTSSPLILFNDAAQQNNS